jgi:hypothetical protein
VHGVDQAVGVEAGDAAGGADAGVEDVAVGKGDGAGTSVDAVDGSAAAAAATGGELLYGHQKASTV